MEATRIGAANTATGIPLKLDPSQTEFNRSNVNWNLLDSLESGLLEPETKMDLKSDLVQDFLLDQDVGSVTLCDSSRLPGHNLAPYKCMLKFGDREIGLLQPLLPIAENSMDVEDVGPSRINSRPPPAPVPAPSSQQGATPPSGIPSTSTSGPGSNPVELQLSAGEEQGILLDEDPTRPEDNPQVLALPRALVARQYWVFRQTNLAISQTYGEPGNRICQQCRRKFSSTRRLRVLAPQHYVNVFCLCGEFSYQRDHVLRHQRISHCHTGHMFVVDQASFPEFRDLVLPHVANPRKQATLAWGFPACRPIQEQEGEPVATSQPAATQPLRVALAWVEGSRSGSPDLSLRPVATGGRRRLRHTTTSHTHTPLEEEVRSLRRRLRRYEEEFGHLRRRVSRLERGTDQQ